MGESHTVISYSTHEKVKFRMREQGLQHISDETEELALGHAYAACGFGPPGEDRRGGNQRRLGTGPSAVQFRFVLELVMFYVCLCFFVPLAALLLAISQNFVTTQHHRCLQLVLPYLYARRRLVPACICLPNSRPD